MVVSQQLATAAAAINAVRLIFCAAFLVIQFFLCMHTIKFQISGQHTIPQTQVKVGRLPCMPLQRKLQQTLLCDVVTLVTTIGKLRNTSYDS
jgi:hypothetical protein